MDSPTFRPEAVAAIRGYLADQGLDDLIRRVRERALAADVIEDYALLAYTADVIETLRAGIIRR